jgi:hypothetical protein
MYKMEIKAKIMLVRLKITVTAKISGHIRFLPASELKANGKSIKQKR